MSSSVEYALPPKGPLPALMNAALMGIAGPRTAARLRLRSGSALRVAIPGLGDAVSVSDPALVKQIFTAPADVVHGADKAPLARTLGPKTSFALDEDEHLRQRRLLLPPFHGARMAGYAATFEQEALREIVTWPVGQDFRSLEPMMRITLNAILRSVFGAAGTEYDQLRKMLPSWVKLGSSLTAVPILQRDLGPWSPWGRFVRQRRRFDEAVDRLIAAGRNDPGLAERTDVLALLLQARYEDGSPMSSAELKDQLLAILVAGHETTAGTLAWGMERLRRHPEIIARLQAEATEGGTRLLDATIYELQRIRPVITGTLRWVHKPFQLGEWLLPPGTCLYVDGVAIHFDPRIYPDPDRFDPDRFLDTKPGTYTWVPYGGGRRRCVGAAFAHLEMQVVLRTVLDNVELTPATSRQERWRFRGVAFAPARGGRTRIDRRREEHPGVDAPRITALTA